jgi:RES domain-containing protein
MKVSAYRIVPADKSKEAFSGDGARLYPGRWNHRGVLVVYCAESVSLAVLEILAHSETIDLLKKYVYIPVWFDDTDCQIIPPKKLPTQWNVFPPSACTRDIGTAWVKNADSVVLGVPSVIIPEAKNYLLNPLHSGMKRIKLGEPRSLAIDQRLIVKSGSK